MRQPTKVRAAGETDSGLQREVNEDRFHCDPARGLFMVIDGVGGQAAGGRAAEIALAMLRARLERETGPTDERVREAIAIANNEIYRLASTRPEWNGMACVLTVAVVENGHAMVGHVGDTRLYKLRNDRVEKITRDHSPIGEREDSDEISESEAMRHPRRNEVYRDVGSEPHQPADVDFADVEPVAFEPDAALLLCSDGLSDLVPSATIGQIVSRHAGHPDLVVRALIDAANEAGGKDNVTAVYVEGERFAASSEPASGARDSGLGARNPGRSRLVRIGIIGLLLTLTGFLALRAPGVREYASAWRPFDSVWRIGSSQTVQPSESIAEAIARAWPGSEIIVEPGEYSERLVLRDGVRVMSRVPRAATIRLPAAAPEAEPAVLVEGLSGGELVGFRIVGDAATPLGTGIRVHDAAISLIDIEITGATNAAVEFLSGSNATLIGSDIHDNPGAAALIRAGASPRISHNAFARNGTPGRVATSILVDPGALPVFQKNVFRGVNPDSLAVLGERTGLALTRENWFLGFHEPISATPAGMGARQGLR